MVSNFRISNYRSVRAAQTKRVYAWMCACIEDELVHYYAVAHRSLDRLHVTADRVLHQEGFQRLEFPALSVGEHSFSWYQTAEGRECSAIFIARYQTCYFILLHELVHAMGYGTHSPAFVLRYIDLLVKYAKCHRERLIISAGLFGAL